MIDPPFQSFSFKSRVWLLQVETLETADGPTRQASEAATVSPEVAREDEERRVLARGKMNQHDTLLGMKQPN